MAYLSEPDALSNPGTTRVKHLEDFPSQSAKAHIVTPPNVLRNLADPKRSLNRRRRARLSVGITDVLTIDSPWRIFLMIKFVVIFVEAGANTVWPRRPGVLRGLCICGHRSYPSEAQTVSYGTQR